MTLVDFMRKRLRDEGISGPSMQYNDPIYLARLYTVYTSLQGADEKPLQPLNQDDVPGGSVRSGLQLPGMRMLFVAIKP